MSLERWNQFTHKQQFGNMAAELGRASSQLSKNKTQNCIDSIYRVLEMLEYQKTIDNNNELCRFNEYVASLIIIQDKEHIDECAQYCLSFAI
jgi:hypothetical protein